MNNFGDHFATTRWSVVLQASSPDDSQVNNALEELCQAYWQPLYAFIRRKGHDPQEAADLTQGFFLHLLQNRILEKTAPHRGRFRSFLLACAQNFLNNEYDYKNALKRGGGWDKLSLDVADAESKFALTAKDQSPEAVFDKQWASALLSRVHQRLQDSTNIHRDDWHEALLCFLTADPDEGSYRELEQQFGVNRVALRVAVFRLREKFRKLLRQEVAETVQDGDSVEQEIAYLLEVLTATA